MSADPRAIVEGFLAAQAAHDDALARTFLADQGFSFSSPIAAFQCADAFIEYASITGGIILDRVTRKVFVDGGDVCHFLTYRIQLSEKQSVDLVQWARVRDGRIQRIETLFDASTYRQLFDEPRPD